MDTKSISINPNICHGKPFIKGTRIMVWQILEMLGSGSKFEEIKEAFPKVTSLHIKACLAYASQLTREDRSGNVSETQTPALSA